MRVDGLIFASEQMMAQVRRDQAPEQVANVAFLPGIQYASLAMPDIHWGYGFTIGGVCATDPEEGGVVSPGGVGYDINCGVRLLRTKLTADDVLPRARKLMDMLFGRIPAGVGRGGPYRFNRKELRRLLAEGSPYLAKRGLATEGDIEHTEAGGALPGADPDFVSERAFKRGADQCGTLGAGNHFLELQIVDEIFDPQAAAAMGLQEQQLCVMIHSGSRGLGYQVCDDSLRELRGVPEKYGIEIPDRQLACAPAVSPEGKRYLGAMAAAANYAWCNRQLLMWQAREVFEEFFGRSWEKLGMGMVYDVAHNIAKLEEHEIEGRRKKVWVHRKGATRAFPAGHPDVPAAYRATGQPVLIPGDMGRVSWVLAGQQASMKQAFGTTCHGAGRAMSRTAAIKHAKGRRIDRELAEIGVIARARSWKGLAEEQPEAYKDVNQVVDVVHEAGLSRKVARLRPIGVIKG
jgi:tRNA-splicing ligase RtcB